MALPRTFSSTLTNEQPVHDVRLAETTTPETRALRTLLSSRRAEFDHVLAAYGATNPLLFGSVARGTAQADSDIDILVEMDPAEGNVLMRASGLLEEARRLFGTEAIDIFPMQLLQKDVVEAALCEGIAV